MLNQTPSVASTRDVASTPDWTKTYALGCADCSFEPRSEGNLEARYEVIEEHQDETRSHPSTHFVEFEALGV